MKNPIIMMIIIALVVGGGAFYGGMQYQKTKVSNPMIGQFSGPQGSGRQGGFPERAGNGSPRFAGEAGQGMMPVSGEVLSVDDTSITVKMQDGSSKIVILSDDTNITKSSEGTKGDLKTGEAVTAFGTTNSDGSITAQNVSIGDREFARLQETN